MKIAIGSDNAGFHLKENIKEYLCEEGHDVTDLGTTDMQEEVRFMYASDNVARAVQAGKAERGIVFCGSGMGVSIIANKHKGIYCAVVESEWAAKSARFINNCNMLALGERIVAPVMARDIVATFLKTGFHENVPEARQALLSDLFDRVVAVEEELL